MARDREPLVSVEPPALTLEVPLFRVRRGLRMVFGTDGAVVPSPRPVDSTAVRNLLMAHRWLQALESGEVRNAKEVAVRLGVSQPRVSMILSLVFLAPDLQEEILGLRECHRMDALGLQALLALARQPCWESQRAALAAVAGGMGTLPENNRGGNRA